MSCGSSCPCQLKWPLDTQGSKRDPINCEKSWLDFAVRLLSREAVGKGRGQETVWSERCKPQWWGKVVGLPWKNPTANPKDSKEVLLKKYTALEKHLREEGRFPSELEEEARLWNEGKYRELFLLTSLTSLLGKVTGVHAAVVDACTKVEELKAKVNQSLLDDIRQCLTSTLQATENLDVKPSMPKSLKRPSSHLGKENTFERPPKRKRTEESTSPTSVLSSKIESQSASDSGIVAQSKDIIAYLQKMLAKRNHQSCGFGPANRCQQKIQPKPPTPGNLTLPPTPIAANLAVAPSPVPALSVQPQSSSNGISLSPEDLNHLLQGNVIVLSQPSTSTSISTEQIGTTEISGGPDLCSTTVLDSNPGPFSTVPEILTTPVSLPREHPVSIHHSNGTTHMSEICNSDLSDSNSTLATDPSIKIPVTEESPDPKFCLALQKNVAPQGSVNEVYSRLENKYESSCSTLSDFLITPQETISDHTTVSTCFPNTDLNSSSPHSEFSTLEQNANTVEIHTAYDSSPHSEFSTLELEQNGSTVHINTSHRNSISTPTVSTTRTSSGRVDSLGSSNGSDSNQSHHFSDAGYVSESSMVDLDQMFSAEEQNQLWAEDGSYLLDRFLDDLDCLTSENDNVNKQLGGPPT